MYCRHFFVLSFFYTVVQVLISLIRFDFDVSSLSYAAERAIGMGAMLGLSLKRMFVPLMVIALCVGAGGIASRWRELCYVSAGSVFLQLGFSFTRNTIPQVVPYYADPYLANLDRWLHMGHDPWSLLYTADGPVISVATSGQIYVIFWSMLAIAFPVLLAFADSSRSRRRRFLALFLFCWFVIGTAIATGVASVGPIFYDRLLGGDRFAGLVAAHAAAGFADSGFGYTQDFLWNGYVDDIAFGGGMSAFPSVHLAVGTVFALYLAERSIWLLPVGMAFVAALLIISVTSGYHYAVDGYASILLVLGAWAMLRVRDGVRPDWSRVAAEPIEAAPARSADNR